eukprot:4182967-Pleurochrysis_carterae.AAC.1
MRARLPSSPSSSLSALATRAAGASSSIARGPQPLEGVGSELAQPATRRCRLVVRCALRCAPLRRPVRRRALLALECKRA